MDSLSFRGAVRPGEPSRVSVAVDTVFTPGFVFIDSGPGELLEVFVAGRPQNGASYGKFTSMNRPGIRVRCEPAHPNDEITLLVKMDQPSFNGEVTEGESDVDPLVRVAEKALAWRAGGGEDG